MLQRCGAPDPEIDEEQAEEFCYALRRFLKNVEAEESQEETMRIEDVKSPAEVNYFE